MDADKPHINRSALIVQPTERYLAWLHAVDPTSRNLSLDDLRGEAHIYLIPECDTEDDLNRVLKRCFDDIFTEELAGWFNIPDVWPDRRTVKMFREWFDVEFASMITDLSDFPLLHDED